MMFKNLELEHKLQIAYSEITELKSKLSKAHSLLKQLEHSNGGYDYPEYNICYVCKSPDWREHSPRCELGNFLKTFPL